MSKSHSWNGNIRHISLRWKLSEYRYKTWYLVIVFARGWKKKVARIFLSQKTSLVARSYCPAKVAAILYTVCVTVRSKLDLKPALQKQRGWWSFLESICMNAYAWRLFHRESEENESWFVNGRPGSSRRLECWANGKRSKISLESQRLTDAIS